MKQWIDNIYFSFPVQLLILHFRRYLLLVLIWFMLALLLSGNFAGGLGGKYLFLAPEYLGKVNAISFFILGLGLGTVLISWNLSTYLLSAYRFPFLATLDRPFTKYCINNFLLPLTFLVVYLFFMITFQQHYEFRPRAEIILNTLSFMGGITALLILSAVYFGVTNKDIGYFEKSGERWSTRLLKLMGPAFTSDGLSSKTFEKHKTRVDIFLNEFLRPRRVRSISHYDVKLVLGVFRQNHNNALIAQVFAIILLIGMGYMMDYSFFRIPAAASIFILASVLISVVGAFSFWFGTWRTLIIVLLLFVINQLSQYKPFDNINHRNKAYGISYDKGRATYDDLELKELTSIGNVEKDIAFTETILENWKVKVEQKYGSEKPIMIFFNVSGGGLKSSVWALEVLRHLQQQTQNKFFDHAILMAGASGGMMGAAYFRELFMRQQNGDQIDPTESKYVDNVSKDLLNPVAFAIVSNDLFLPWVKFEKNGHIYRKDRGYIFEKQFNENTDFILDKPLSEYSSPEANAEIPMMFITPSIINDGRRLIISPHRVTYMMSAPAAINIQTRLETDAVDFNRLFENQDATELNFVSALRMNATYPYILPNVTLPTEPMIEVMDSGFRDNDGTKSSARFIQVFLDWIKENTKKVLIVQVSGAKVDISIDDENEGVIESFFNPLGIAGRILDLQHYEHDSTLGFVCDLLGEENVELIKFTYYPTLENQRASMSFHMTRREKIDVLAALNLPENISAMERVVEVLGE